MYELADAGERLVVLDNLSTGLMSILVTGGAGYIGSHLRLGRRQGRAGYRRRHRRLELGGSDYPRSQGRLYHPFRCCARRAGFGQESARLLQEQHCQLAGADRNCR